MKNWETEQLRLTLAVKESSFASFLSFPVFKLCATKYHLSGYDAFSFYS
jgi:hypothetical protein